MITLNYNCCRCGKENTSMGADRFLGMTPVPVVLRLHAVPCCGCWNAMLRARDALLGWWEGQHGEWR